MTAPASEAVALRGAAGDDAEAIVVLVNSAYRGEGSKRGWTTEADILGGQRTDAGKVMEMIQGPASRVELAFSPDGALIGCVYLEKKDGDCYLGMLTVSPVLQGGGLGKRILEHAEDVARAWGCGRMRLCVIHVREELIRFYERRGYARTGAAEPFPEGDPRFGIPKVRGLTFLTLAKPLDR